MRSTASATRSGSAASSGSGWRVSTRQKPHARVQRSPLIMNVAVPSAQHSKMLGQPASSQTVTRSRSRIVLLEPHVLGAQCGPWPAATRACGSRSRGRRSRRPRPAARAGGTDERAPARGAAEHVGRGPPVAGALAAAERRQVVGRGGARPTSWRSTLAPPPHSAAARARDGVDHRLHATRRGPRRPATSPPCRRCRRGRCGRTSPGRWSTLRAKPCIVRPRVSRTPMAAILRGSVAVGLDPHARVAVEPAGAGQPEVGQRVDEQLLDRADVGDGVGHAGRPRLPGRVRIG